MISIQRTIEITTLSSGVGGEYEPLQLFSVEWFMLLGVTLLFAALAGWLIWLYYKYKPQQEMFEAKYSHRSAGSFAGFWGRNRTRIIGFVAAICLMISIFFLIFVCFGIFPYTTWL